MRTEGDEEMYAISKKRVMEVEIDLSTEDFELKEKDEFAYGTKIKSVLEQVLGRKINHWGYKPAKVHAHNEDGSPMFGTVVAYYEWEPKVIEQLIKA